jgi:uncharacterized protein YndB with AHSA1/START domain
MNATTITKTFVRKELVVGCGRARAFEAFTREFGQWWPLASHHIGAAMAETAVIEPFVNGRWFERATDGTECDWGRVLTWEPPGRLVLSWNITTSWQFDITLETEVEVTFHEAGSGRTRIVLEHRHLDRYGAEAEKMRSTFDSEGGWSGMLQQFASHIKGQPTAMADCPDGPQTKTSANS